MVAMNVWPTDAADGSVASEARWRKMGRLWAQSGVADNIGGEMVPSLAGVNLTVRSGACWVDGHYCELAGDQVLTVTANGLAVVRFDPAANSAELLYRDGATTPTQNPSGIWEQPIASISGSAMTDRRGILINPAAASKGVVAFGRGSPGEGTFSAVADIFGMAVAYKQIAGRTYSVRAAINLGVPSVNGSIAGFQIADASGATQGSSITLATGQYTTVSLEEIYTAPTTADVTRRAQLGANSGSVDYIGSFGRAGYIVVTDLGVIG